MSIDGAEKSVQKSAFFTEVLDDDGMIDHLADPSGDAVDDHQQKAYADILKAIQGQKHKTPQFRDITWARSRR